MNGHRISFSWLLPFVENELDWASEMQSDYEDSPMRGYMVPFKKIMFIPGVI